MKKRIGLRLGEWLVAVGAAISRLGFWVIWYASSQGRRKEEQWLQRAAVFLFLLSLGMVDFLAIRLVTGGFSSAEAAFWQFCGPAIATLALYGVLAAGEAPLNFAFSRLRPPTSTGDWAEVAKDILSYSRLAVIISGSFFLGTAAQDVYLELFPHLPGAQDSALIWLNLVQATVTGYAFVGVQKQFAKRVDAATLARERLLERQPGMMREVARWFFTIGTFLIFLASILYVVAVIVSTFSPDWVPGWVLASRLSLGLPVIAMCDNFAGLSANFIFRRGRPRDRYDLAVMMRGIFIALVWSIMANEASFSLAFVAYANSGLPLSMRSLCLIFWQQLYRNILDVPQSIYNALEGHRSHAALRRLHEEMKIASKRYRAFFTLSLRKRQP